MFYSETLLAKSGPLARVWLSANIERKLTRTHILQSNIESSVSAIVDQGQAPLALRLSGQLLLGVVRIYSRKARYLLDDCNEALNKIKMTFRPGNVDMPANQTNTANPASLTLPDVLTELDLNAPLEDPSLLLSQPFDDILERPDMNLLDFSSSQLLTSPFRRTRRASIAPLGLEEDIGLDLDLGNDVIPPSVREREIEIGRDAPPSRTLAEDFDDTMKLYDDDLELDLGMDNAVPDNRRESTILPDFGDTNMGQDSIMQEMEDNLGFQLDDDHAALTSAPLQQARRRDSQSTLSSIRSSVERDLEKTFEEERAPSVLDLDEASVHQAQRAKKRKVLQLDTETELHSNQIRAQQNDRSKILKPVSFIPRDPLLLALMEMQKNGEFVSNILSDGRSKGWAPELRGILSLEIVRTPLKRKRENNMIKSKETAVTSPIPQIRLPSELNDDVMPREDSLGFAAEETILGGDDITQLPPNDDDLFAVNAGVDHEILQSSRSHASTEHDHSDIEPVADFDENAATSDHPLISGPISLGTRHAVHLLRDHFGNSSTPSKRAAAKTSVLFQDLLPESRTTRADATKMFFEVLVLATKDAVSVEQESGVVGGKLRIKGKRGLWGDWAEREAGGEIEAQEGEGGVVAV